MKKNFLSTLCLLVVSFIFTEKSHADEATPDFFYGNYGCFITSEENAEVAIYYYNEDDLGFSALTYLPSRELSHKYFTVLEESIERWPTIKKTFPAEVKNNNKTYTVTSIYPYNYTDNADDQVKYVVGITEIELPSTIKTMPDVNPFKYFADLYNITIAEGNEYFTTIEGCLYSSDGSILYAVPTIPYNMNLSFNERIRKIETDAFFNTVANNIDLSELRYLEPTNSSLFNNISPISRYLYLPPNLYSFEIDNLPQSFPKYYYLPTSCNISGTGLFYAKCNIDTYSTGKENLKIYNDRFYCIDNGTKLVGCNLEYLVDVYDYIFDCLEFWIEIPKGIKQITSHLFSNQYFPQRLKEFSFMLPSTITTIGDYTFEGYNGHSRWGNNSDVDKVKLFCRDSGKIWMNKLPEELETMGKGCFMRSMLQEITIPNVKYIPELAFAGCRQLEKITFGAGVEGIELSAIFAEVTDSETNEKLLTPETCVIKCLSQTPPHLLSTNFDETQTFNNTVIVPDDAIEDYKKEWGDKFANIYTVTESSINMIFADDNFKGNNSEIDNSEETYYNLNGQRMAGTRDTLAPGLYICRKANKTSKLIIR